MPRKVNLPPAFRPAITCHSAPLAAVLVLLVSTLPAFAQSQQLRVEEPTAAAFQNVLDELQELRERGVTDPVTIELAEGTYHLDAPLTLDPALVADGLTLQGPQQGTVALSGSQPLELAQPEPVSGSGDRPQWRYQLPEGWNDEQPPRLLVVDEQLSTAARLPDEGYFRIEASLPDRRSGFTVAEGDLPAGFELGEDPCDLVLLHDWSSSRLPVQSFDSDSHVLRSVGPIGCSADHYRIDHFEKQPRYWLEGHRSFANVPGEWFFDRGAQQIAMVAESDSETPPEVSLPVTPELLVASGDEDEPLENVRIRRLRFTATQFMMPAGGLAGAQATMHEPRDASGERTTGDRPMLGAAVHIERATGTVIEDCTFDAIGQTALWLGSQTRQCVVQRCEFRDLGGNAINLGENNSRRVDGQTWYQAAPEQVPTGNVVRDSEIRRCGQVLPGAVAVWAALHRDLLIEKNLLEDCPYTGISLGWLWNDSESPARSNRIAHNRIQRMMQVLSDGGGIYTLGRQPESVIEHNVISDIPLNAGRAESNGMFLDEGTTGFTIRENTIRRTDRSPLRFHRAGRNLVTNNAWELPTESTPPIRFNNTPETAIESRDNRVLP